MSIPNGSWPLLIFKNVVKGPSALPHLEWQPCYFCHLFTSAEQPMDGSHVRFGTLTWGKTSPIALILVEYSRTYQEK